MSNSKQRVDYDQIAHLYDEPGRDYSADPFLKRFLDEKDPGLITTCSVLDIGCGTGKQLAANYAAYPEFRLVGLDLFRGMLEQARTRCREVDWVQGDCTCQPFADESFNYLTSQFSYHHVRDKRALIAEAYRLLRPGGQFILTNLDPWAMEDWIVYQFFPASQRRDFDDFLPLERLVALLELDGFHDIQKERETNRTDEDLGKFLDYASQRYRTSQLMVLEDADYMDGVSRLKEVMDKGPAGVRRQSTISLVWIRAEKPG
jgi:SAM-dependent methyltransferase